MPEFTNPFSGVIPRKMSATELARAIMLDISAELEAIHLYQAHIDATDDERAKMILAHVRDEEKEHVGEFMALLEHLDPGLADFYRKGHAETLGRIGALSGTAQEAGESPPEMQAEGAQEPAQAEEAPGEAVPLMSVGDLRGR